MVSPLSCLPLLLKEAGLEDDAASFYFAVDFFRIFSKADASDLCSALDDH